MNWEELLAGKTLHDRFDFNTPSIAPLKDYCLIFVKGPDAEKFLQGQCTCDFSALNENKILLGAHCTHKGRMNSNFVAARIDDDTVALRMHESISEHAMAALQKYAVFSKVTLTLDDSYKLLGILGPIDENEMPNPGEFGEHDNRHVLNHGDGLVEYWCRDEETISLLSQQDQLPIQRSSNAWQLQNIRRGIAELRSSTIETLIPQEINLQLVGGVSFDKGCYTGQEVVARLHYRGKLKKHMARGYVDTEKSPSISETIFENSELAKPRGMVINVAKSGHSGYEFLALCDDEITEKNTGILSSNSEAKIQWKPLPYAIS